MSLNGTKSCSTLVDSWLEPYTNWSLTASASSGQGLWAVCPSRTKQPRLLEHGCRVVAYTCCCFSLSTPQLHPQWFLSNFEQHSSLQVPHPIIHSPLYRPLEYALHEMSEFSTLPSLDSSKTRPCSRLRWPGKADLCWQLFGNEACVRTLPFRTY